MDEAKKEENHVTSAAAFVEGGIQDACDDACSICLEAFFDSDPSSVTSCKHEFHLQCILEWCQRSSNCPMCWQPICLKDPASQELLEAVERERVLRFTPSRNMTIFHHPTLGDFELQHLPIGVNDPELEDRIIQHLAAAAAMGRTHRIARREGSRSHSSAHARPQFVVFSANSDSSSTGILSRCSDSLYPIEMEIEPAAATVINSSNPIASVHTAGLRLMPSSPQSNEIPASSSGSIIMPTSCQGISIDNRNRATRSSSPKHDSAGPSELHSFPDNWKHRFSAMSMKYKESNSKSTRGWKEKLFSRSSSMADIGSGVRREVSAGIATVSRMMERLKTRDNDRAVCVPPANNVVDSRAPRERNRESADIATEALSDGSNSASVASRSILS